MKLYPFIAFLLLFLLLPFSVFAADQQTVILSKNETVNHDYFATGGSVDIAGTVNGDVYAGGGNVLIDGTVNGDVLAAGGQVTVRGTVQNIRVAGGQIVIDGKVNGNVTALGGNITTTDTSTISGGLVGAGGQYNLLGPVGKTVSIASGQITLGSMIGSDVWLNSQTIILTPQAKVNGNVSYVSPQNAQIANGAIISGKVSHSFPPQKQERHARGLIAALAGLRIGVSIVSFLVSLVFGLLLFLLIPVYSERITEHISRHPWQSLLVGIVGWVLTPLAIILLTITLIGIPFAVVVGIAIGILSYIGKILAAVVIGQWIVARFDKRKNNIVALLVGLIAVEIVGLIPVLGWLFAFIVAAIGFGAVLFMERIYYTEFRAKKLI